MDDSKKLNDKVKIIDNKKLFNPPLNKDGKPYWIPIVVRDKSYLLGFINAYRFIEKMCEIEIQDVDIVTSSDRFNDILTDGTRIHTLTREKLKLKLKELFFKSHEEKHPENNTTALEQYYLYVSCVNCGMFYGFKKEHDVPEHDLKCDVCDNVLISYINESDDYFDFDGDPGDIETIVEEINKECDN